MVLLAPTLDAESDFVNVLHPDLTSLGKFFILCGIGDNLADFLLASAFTLLCCIPKLALPSFQTL